MGENFGEFFVDFSFDFIVGSVLNYRHIIARKKQGHCLPSDKVVMVVKALRMVLKYYSMWCVIVSKEQPWKLLLSSFE